MKDCNCGYCAGGEKLAAFGIKICDLSVSQLILFKEQSHPGRVIVAYKDHVSELVDIPAQERSSRTLPRPLTQSTRHSTPTR